jgi:hypothetical protein
MKSELRRITREELLRSIAWAGLGLVGWPILISEFAWLDATLFTVLGLPVLTWGFLTAAMIGIRVWTDTDLRVRSAAGFSVALAAGILLAGLGSLYLVAAQGYSAVWVGAGYVGVTAITIVWYWYAGASASDPNLTV